MKCIAKPALVGRTEPLNGLSQTASYRGLFVIYLCFFLCYQPIVIDISIIGHTKKATFTKNSHGIQPKFSANWMFSGSCTSCVFFFFFFFGQWNHLMVTCSYCECKVLHKTVIHDKPRSYTRKRQTVYTAKTELLNSYN